MFRLIAIFFFLFSILIDCQFVSNTLPHFSTKDFTPVSAVVNNTNVEKVNNRQIYNVKINYSYVVNDQNYNGSNIQTEEILFNNQVKANSFLQEYSVGSNITAYYNPKEIKTSYLMKGLTNKDLNTLLMLIPINMTSLLVLYLGFILNWNFNKRNRGFTPIRAGMLGSLAVGIPCSLILIFAYNLEASNTLLTLVLLFNIITFISVFIFKKMTTHSMHKYQRSNTVDYTTTLREGKNYTVQGIYKLKRDGFLPIVMIDCLLFMAILFSWAKNQFILDNTVAILITLAILITVVYLYSLTTHEKNRHKHEHSFTAH